MDSKMIDFALRQVGEANPLLSLLLRPMEFSIMLDTCKSRWFIVYIEGLQFIISEFFIFLSLKINFV